MNSTGYIYVADSANHRVQVFNSSGTYQYTIGTTGVSSSGPGQFNVPYGVAVNTTGHLYVSEANNHRVQVFDNAGIHKYNITASFNGPSGVAVNATGHLYVADTMNHRVQVFDKAGLAQYILGGGGYGTGNYKFHSPDGVAVNSTGYLYVADTMNHRVQVFDKAGFYQYTIGNSLGSSNDRFNNPEGVGLNSSNHLYVVDTQNHRVQVFNNGTPISLKISFSSGWPDTNSTSVTLALSAHDASQMCFSNNGTTFTDWEPYGPSKVWTLDNLAGVRTIYFKTKNTQGESATVFNSTTLIMNPTGLTLQINSGDTETDNTSVTLTPGATGATEMRFSNNGTSYTIWETFNPTKAWTLVGEPGQKTVFFMARNSSYWTGPVNASLIYVLHPSGLSILINAGDTDTNTTNVNLGLTATAASEMCFSNNGVSYTTWEPFSPTKAWTLDGGPGPKTVYFKARNYTFETTPVFDDIKYSLTPTGLSVSINSGAAETGSASVTLTLVATGATEMRFSNNGTTYTSWEAFTSSKDWKLDDLAGLRTVYFQVKNGSFLAWPVTDNITYVAPPSLILIINDGAVDTDTRSVTLIISAYCAAEMCFSNDNTTWYPWEPIGTIKFWGLWGGPGPKTVFLKARNSIYETITSANITYILPPTGVSITINDGAAETGNANVTLTLSATGAQEICFSNDGAAWSAWEPYGTGKAWVLSSTGGYKTVYFRVRNDTIEAAEPDAANITYIPLADVPTWMLLLAVIGGAVVIIYVLRRKSPGRVIPPEIGGEKTTRLGLLKGKISQLKGKIFKQDAKGASTGEKKPDEKVTEVAWKPSPEPVPKPILVPAPE